MSGQTQNASPPGDSLPGEAASGPPGAPRPGLDDWLRPRLDLIALLIVVVGSRKRVIFDDLNTGEQVKVFEKGVAVSEKEADGFGEFRLLVRDGEIVSPKVEPSEPLKNQCSHFLHCISSGQSPLTDARNGYEVVRVLEKVGRSLESGGTAVST